MTYGMIIVRSAKCDKLTLTFVSRDVFDESRRRLAVDTTVEVLDAFWGYQAFDDCDDAMRAVSVWCS